MITKTGQNAMNEEFMIVVNPTMDDISILGPHIRFIADTRMHLEFFPFFWISPSTWNL